MTDLLLRGCVLPGRPRLVDISIANGRITELLTHEPGVRAPANERIDVGGRVVTPGLVEAHIHLDKALLSERLATGAESALDAIRMVAEAKRGFTADDIRQRSCRVLDMAIAAGTTAMRVHVEVDPIIGLTSMETALALKQEYAPAIDLRLCAFAQEGILQAPGTEGLLRLALQMGADAVGGVPYNDRDADQHIDIVFGLAQAFNVDVDFHIDFFDEPAHMHIRKVIDRTHRTGWRGRVAVGHLSEASALPAVEQKELAEDLAKAGIGVISLPATDLYLMGRNDDINPPRGLAPIRRLLAADVPVALGTNNVRNPFTPVGTADLAHMAFLASVAAHMGTPQDLRTLVDCLTIYPARILRLPDYGIVQGCRADLVVWDCERVEDIVAAQPFRPWVIKNGRVTVEHERRIRLRWKEGPG